jgi:FdhE protein
LSLTLQTIEQRVAEVRQARVQYGEVVAWLGRLLAETVKVGDQVRLPELTLAPERTGEAFTAGRPLFAAAELPLDMELTRRLYAVLVKMVDGRKAGREQVEGLNKALDPAQGDPPKALLAALGMDLAGLTALGQELGAAPQVLDMLLRLAARPSLLATSAAALKQVDLERWTQGHCPVCGSPPRLADLSGEGGRRRLHCALCETAWYFRRRHCPFCLNDDPETQEVLLSEGEEGLRVDLCLVCGQHVKTLDLRVLSGPVIVWLDDLSTWHLDLAADKRLEEVGAMQETTH